MTQTQRDYRLALSLAYRDALRTAREPLTSVDAVIASQARELAYWKGAAKPSVVKQRASLAAPKRKRAPTGATLPPAMPSRPTTAVAERRHMRARRADQQADLTAALCRAIAGAPLQGLPAAIGKPRALDDVSHRPVRALGGHQVTLDYTAVPKGFTVAPVRGDGDCGFVALLAGTLAAAASGSHTSRRALLQHGRALPRVAGHEAGRRLLSGLVVFLGARTISAAAKAAVWRELCASGGAFKQMVAYLRRLVNNPKDYAEYEELQKLADTLGVALCTYVGYTPTATLTHGDPEERPGVHLLLVPNHFELLVPPTSAWPG